VLLFYQVCLTIILPILHCILSEHKFEIVKILQEKQHVVGMTGDGVNDAPALKKADIGIAVSDATDAARSAADLVLTEPGLSVIVSAVLTSRAIFQRMKNYTVECVVFLFFCTMIENFSFCLFIHYVASTRKQDS